jgi:ATP-dependent DNA ligase
MHHGHRLMMRRDGPRVRCFTRGGHDGADRFPAIVDAATGRDCTDEMGQVIAVFQCARLLS